MFVKLIISLCMYPFDYYQSLYPHLLFSCWNCMFVIKQSCLVSLPRYHPPPPRNFKGSFFEWSFREIFLFFVSIHIYFMKIVIGNFVWVRFRTFHRRSRESTVSGFEQYLKKSYKKSKIEIILWLVIFTKSVLIFACQLALNENRVFIDFSFGQFYLHLSSHLSKAFWLKKTHWSRKHAATKTSNVKWKKNYLYLPPPFPPNNIVFWSCFF